MGTLSKAYGAIGGFVAADTAITEVLRLSCAAYGFTSTLPPDQALAVSEALDAVRDEPERRARLWANQRYFVARMAQLPFTLVSTATPIVPIMIGDEAAADRFAALLTAERIHVDAVKFPAVPMHKARLRVQLNAGHTRAQIDHLVDILTENQDLVGGEKSRPPMIAGTSAAFNHGRARPWAIAARSYAQQAALAAFAGLRDTASAAVARMAGLANQRLPSLGLSLNMVTLATAVLVAIDLYFDVPHRLPAADPFCRGQIRQNAGAGGDGLERLLLSVLFLRAAV
jgi:hypothetical protein